MNDDKTGGTAFPAAEVCDRDLQCVTHKQSKGMTLRDYFAAKAMPVALDAAWRDEWCFDGFDSFYEMIASTAYAMADAMLAEREKQK